jgi:hypothetical protein
MDRLKVSRYVLASLELLTALAMAGAFVASLSFAIRLPRAWKRTGCYARLAKDIRLQPAQDCKSLTCINKISIAHSQQASPHMYLFDSCN